MRMGMIRGIRNSGVRNVYRGGCNKFQGHRIYNIAGSWGYKGTSWGNQKHGSRWERAMIWRWKDTTEQERDKMSTALSEDNCSNL